MVLRFLLKRNLLWKNQRAIELARRCRRRSTKKKNTVTLSVRLRVTPFATCGVRNQTIFQDKVPGRQSDLQNRDGELRVRCCAEAGGSEQRRCDSGSKQIIQKSSSVIDVIMDAKLNTSGHEGEKLSDKLTAAERTNLMKGSRDQEGFRGV